MFRLIIDVGMGFTQSWRYQTGQEKLWQALHRVRIPGCLVLPPATWDSDPLAAAGFIDRNLEPGGRVVLIGYSWGGGWRAPRLARALGECARTVHHLILCDPVYRSPWLPTWLPFNPASLTRFPKIPIPGNVERVSWFYQREGRPWGHEPVAEEPLVTRVEAGIHLPGYRHDGIDDADEYLAHVLGWSLEWAGVEPRS